MRSDTHEIVQGLTDRLEALLDDITPGWVQAKGVGYLSAKGPKDLGSWQVQLAGQKRGTWYRFSQGVGGGPVALIAYCLTGDTSSRDAIRDAFAYARRFLGIGEAAGSGSSAPAVMVRKPQTPATGGPAGKADTYKRDRRELAALIWQAAAPINGTPADAYLQSRAIPPVIEWPWDPRLVLGYHPSVPHPNGRSYRALVCKAVDAFGDLAAIWCIALDPKEPRKATIDAAKFGIGPVAGAAVRVGGDGPRIGAAEGIESAISHWLMIGCRRPVWAMLSTSGLINFEPPTFVKAIDGYPDGDRAKFAPDGSIMAPPGMKAMRALEDRAKGMGITFRMNQPPFHGDGNDILMQMGGWAGVGDEAREQAGSSREGDLGRAVAI